MTMSGKGAGFGVVTAEALGEKAEMQHLNSKLAEYMDKVQALKKSASLGVDPQSYQESMKRLENEVLKLQAVYDDELQRMRRDLEDKKRKIIALEAEQGKEAELRQQLNEKNEMMKRLQESNTELQTRLHHAEQLLGQLQDKVKQAEEDVAHGNRWRHDNDDLRKQLTAEVARRQHAENEAKQANDKVSFDARVHDQRTKELEERTKAQADVISALEKRIKALAKDNGNLPATVQKIREANQAEMMKFQRETENTVNRNMDTLKQQLQDDRRAKDQLARDVTQLEEALRQMAIRNQELEGQNKGLLGANQALKEENEGERARAQRAVGELEQKLAALQRDLMDNSKEFTNTRDAQASLRNEIDTYRLLLEQEARRLESRQGGRSVPQAATPSYAKPAQTTGLPSIAQAQQQSNAGNPFRPGYTGFDTTYRLDYTPKIRY